MSIQFNCKDKPLALAQISWRPIKKSSSFVFLEYYSWKTTSDGQFGCSHKHFFLIVQKIEMSFMNKSCCYDRGFKKVVFDLFDLSELVDNNTFRENRKLAKEKKWVPIRLDYSCIYILWLIFCHWYVIHLVLMGVILFMVLPRNWRHWSNMYYHNFIFQHFL